MLLFVFTHHVYPLPLSQSKGELGVSAGLGLKSPFRSPERYRWASQLPVQAFVSSLAKWREQAFPCRAVGGKEIGVLSIC